VLLVLLGGLDAEVLDALVLRQVVVVDLHSLSLALVVALLSIGCGGLRLGVVINIDAEDLLKRSLIHTSSMHFEAVSH
jgi:hypothetical protein